MSSPIDAFLEKPTYPDEEYKQAMQDWDDQAEKWQKLNEKVSGNPAFYPLTIKAFYVFGVIHQICECVSILLDSEQRDITYIPAYGVLASGIELLGRCITGNPSAEKSGEDIKTGFWWLAKRSYQGVDLNHILITTERQEYRIAHLIALRHFAAHGQATMKMNSVVEFDDDIFAQIGKPGKHLIANGLENYWAEVQKSEEICNRLARANIMPFRNPPLVETLKLFSALPSQSIGDIFRKFDWHNKR